jgi:pilus assembly protein CpaE
MQEPAASADVIEVAAPATFDTATTEHLEMPDRRRVGRLSNVDPALLPLLRRPAEAADARRMSMRHHRPALVAFVTDGASERALKDGLVDAIIGTPDIRRGGVRTAIAAMEHAITPNVLIVDITGEDQPLTALAQLANVVEPDACVLVIGETDSVDFYREITRSLGANDYFRKPLTNDKVLQIVAPLVAGNAPASDDIRGGGLVILTGVRGGVGATTLAINLAGHFGISMRRHTVLLDPDVHLGDAAFQLNVKPGPGLRMALEAPERIDALLAERAAQPAADRLHVLSGEESLTSKLNYAAGGIGSLMIALRRRYNFIIADVPFRPSPLHDDLLKQPHQRVLVMLPNLSSVRATLRLMSVSAKAEAAKRPMIVLNRVGAPGGLTRREVEDALAVNIDVAIPDQPRQAAAAAAMGELALTGKSAIRTGVLELARHVGSAGLLDAPMANSLLQDATRTRSAWRLLWRKS